MSNPLSTILDVGRDFLSSIKKGASSSVVGIDIGSSAIKVVQLKKEEGRIVLETYGSIALGPYVNKEVGEIPALSADVLKTAVLDVLKESNVTTKETVFSIQAGGSLVFVVDLPPMSERELKTAVPSEARKFIPVPITEVSLDWWLIPRQPVAHVQDDQAEKEVQPRTEVLVAAIRNETIAQYSELVQSTGLSSDTFEIEIFSTIRSSFEHEIAPVLLVDFGASSTRIAVVEYGVVKKFHTASRGSQYLSESIATSLGVPFTKAEELKKEVGLVGGSAVEHAKEIAETLKVGTNYVFSEVNSVLLSYEKTYHKAVGKIIFTGGGTRLKGFLERAKEEFNFPIAYGDPFKKTKSPEFLAPILTEAGPEFAVAVGLALKKLM